MISVFSNRFDTALALLLYKPKILVFGFFYTYLNDKPVLNGSFLIFYGFVDHSDPLAIIARLGNCKPAIIN